MSTTFYTRIKIRRTNDYNYSPDFIPLQGELCLVDTALNGLQLKVGDGDTTFANLPYEHLSTESPIQLGYYFDDDFYKDAGLTIPINKTSDWFYVDLGTMVGYIFTNGHFAEVKANVPAATSSIEGIMKLYSQTGYNTDGTMTQKAITDEFDKINAEVVGDTLIINL